MTKARSNATANAAKGDLTVGTGTNLSGVLSVSQNGETIVADSSTSTGLSYQSNWAAGKNKIINGDFTINQRSFTSTTSTNFGIDRWLIDIGGDGTTTWSTQVFTPGTAPVAGYESTNYSRIVTTGQTSAAVISRLGQKIENVKTFAGQTVTVSFWAKAATGTPSITPELQQVFGTGGSPSATVNAIIASTPKQAITTSWARYSFNIAIPSISGKTIGTNNDSNLTLGLYVSAGSNFNARTGTLGIQTNTFEVWGVQVEAGSVATAFQTATGTIQGELAACQRYYYRTGLGSANNTTYGVGMATSTTQAQIYIQYPVTMRVLPSSIDYADLAVSDLVNYTVVLTTLALSDRNNIGGKFVATVASGLSQYRPTFLINNTNVTGYLGFSAEL